MSPLLTEVGSGSRVGSAFQAMTGMASVFDELRPGVTAKVSFGPGDPCERVVLLGHLMTCAVAGTSITMRSFQTFQTATLTPGRDYVAEMEGETVRVVAVG